MRELNYKYNGKELQETGMYDYGWRQYMPDVGRWMQLDPLADIPHSVSMSPYATVANNPLRFIDPDGMDWVESANGNVIWRDDVTAENYQNKGVLKKGEIYRGTSYEREKVWSNVNVRGNIENGIMKEVYGENGKMTYTNQTPWVDKAFEEMAKNISETGSNPEITKYWNYTQMPEAAARGDKWAQSVLKEDQTPWCAAFVNCNLETSGIEGTKFATAYSFKKYGQDLGREKPFYGSIAVMNYSHVGFVVGINKDGRIILLGGNQGNAVNLSPNGQSSVIKYVYPKGYNPSGIALPRYNLTGRSLTGATSR